MNGEPKPDRSSFNDYVRFSIPYVIYVILGLLFYMWIDQSAKFKEMAKANMERNDKMEAKITELQKSVAVYQAQGQVVLKMMDKVDMMDRRLTREETILELHREDSDYDKMKKFPDKKRLN